MTLEEKKKAYKFSVPLSEEIAEKFIQEFGVDGIYDNAKFMLIESIVHMLSDQCVVNKNVATPLKCEHCEDVKND